jgi:hypothetical protein
MMFVIIFNDAFHSIQSLRCGYRCLEARANPEQILTKEALLQPHRTVVSNDLIDMDNSEVQTLSAALRDMMRRELLNMKDQE